MSARDHVFSAVVGAGAGAAAAVSVACAALTGVAGADAAAVSGSAGSATVVVAGYANELKGASFFTGMLAGFALVLGLSGTFNEAALSAPAERALPASVVSGSRDVEMTDSGYSYNHNLLFFQKN